MNPCRKRWRIAVGLAVCWLGWLGCLPAFGRVIEPMQRSFSWSKQFIVFSPDVRLRMAVTTYAETSKNEVLELLGMRDHWKIPIVISLRPPVSTEPNQPLSQVQLIQTEGGWKVQVDVLLRESDLKQVHFPELIVRAILLELAYRDHPPAIGSLYAEPPAWLVVGITHRMQVRAAGGQPNAALFRQLIETGRLPKIRDFLKSNVSSMDATSLAIYSSCAASLLEMLTDTPGGPGNLVRMIKGLNEAEGDAVDVLLKNFPALGGDEGKLEKSWTLGLARYSVQDRHLALSVPETNAQLAELLKLTLVTDEKKDTKKEFALAEYKEFIKLPEARMALFNQCNALAGLMARAHPLLRPVVLEYQRIITELARGKTRHMDDAIATIESYRGLIVDRVDKIADYLNWYEATQMPEQSGAFDEFLNNARELEKWTPPKRNDAISKYIDQLEREFE